MNHPSPTLQLAVQLLLLLLQPADPALKGLHLLSSPAAPLHGPPVGQHLAAHAATVGEAAVGGVGEAHERQVLTREAGVGHLRGDVLCAEGWEG